MGVRPVPYAPWGLGIVVALGASRLEMAPSRNIGSDARKWLSGIRNVSFGSHLSGAINGLLKVGSHSSDFVGA